MKTLKWITVGLLIFILLCPTLFPDKEVEQKPTTAPIEIIYDFSLCPIEIIGSISEYGDNYLLNLTFKNLSEYTISAIKCIFVCYNVYGEQYGNARSFTYQKYCIDSNSAKSAQYLISEYDKSVKIYAYSVYYKNNYYPEWGYRSISTNNIINNAPMTYIEYTR